MPYLFAVYAALPWLPLINFHFLRPDAWPLPPRA